MDKKYEFSLVWPDYHVGKEYERKAKTGEGRAFNIDVMARDINVDMIMSGMDIRNEARGYIRDRLVDMVIDYNVIKYRQDILKDFMKCPDIEERFDTTMLPAITNLRKMEKANLSHDDSLRQIAWRIDMLRIYVQCVEVLYDLFVFNDRQFESSGVIYFRDMIREMYTSDSFTELRRILPDFYDRLLSMKSVTIGINLNSELKAEEAIILSVNEKEFKRKGVMTSILGLGSNDMTYSGLSPFFSILKENKANSLDVAIMRELDSVVGDSFKNIAATLNRFEWIETRFLFDLLPEVYFYIGGCRFARALTNAAMPVCFPTPKPADDRVFKVKDIYDAGFALRILCDMNIEKIDNIVVTNDVDMSDEAGRICILTGANQGGKTTYTRAVGIAQMLFQTGYPIPGSSGEMSPVDNILTHFPELETNSLSESRLGEECVRFEEILPRLTKYSLILMNESLSSTSHQECLFIAEEIMKYMRTVGVRCVFATHIHELAEDIPELNREPALSDLVSLVAGVDENEDIEVLTTDGKVKYEGSKRTYIIRPMPPQGKSFALDIARTYGITFDQLMQAHNKNHQKD